MSEHTPTPWSTRAGEDGDEEVDIVAPYPGLKGEALYVAQTFGMHASCGDPSANAAFIVRAVNAHDDLVAALELVAQRCGPNSDDGAIARAALAKAKGRAS